ncbi:MAG: hypothetical protein EXX96DRAFT_645442 [Benjaminiella poitrasii]|nr:MAG: hypothetical protein EXX96DRAFT_645442 [Benjaminiella poitrasii]
MVAPVSKKKARLPFFSLPLIFFLYTMDSSEQASTSSHSSITLDSPITTSLKPNEYTKGLDQEHITRLTKDAYKYFTEYTKAELELTVDDCQLLETMNKTTKEKYVQMNQMSQQLMKEMSKLQNTYADFSNFTRQIEEIHDQSIQMERTAKALDEYSRYLAPFRLITSTRLSINSCNIRSSIRDSHVLVKYFLRALSTQLVERINLTLESAVDGSKNNLEFVCSKARNLHNQDRSFRACSVTKNKRSFSASDDPQGSSRSKYVPTKKSSLSSSSLSSSSHGRKRPKIRSGKFCSFHRVTSHNTDECEALKRGDTPKEKRVHPFRNRPTSGVSSSDVAIRTMSVPSSSPKAKVMGDDSVPETTNRLENMVIDYDEESLLVAANAQKCKFDKQFSIAPKQTSKSIILPVIIENVKIYALLDTGATCSCISPSFFNSFGSSVSYTKNTGKVQLAHEDVQINRIGHTVLSVFYNKIIVKHTFEIFPFHSTENVPICLGLDIMPKLNIGITGIITSHFDQNSPRKPDPIDPDNIKPNDDPCGTITERKPALDLITQLLKINSEIDMKNTSCNLPGSTIYLKTKPGTVAQRRQYPLPEAYCTVMQEQIDTWLAEGVIEKASSHTSYNSSLLVDKKKDSQGNYSMKKPRIVCDARLLNRWLLVNDKQQFLLISSTHQRTGSAPIHSILDIHVCFTSFAIHEPHRIKLAFTSPYTEVQYVHRKTYFDFPFNVYVRGIIISTFSPLFCYTDYIVKAIQYLTLAIFVLNSEKACIFPGGRQLSWLVDNQRSTYTRSAKGAYGSYVACTGY